MAKVLKIQVKVIPRSKKFKIEFLDEGKLKIHLTAPAIENKANEQLIKVLSKTLKIKKNYIHILSGLKSRDKLIQITDMSIDELKEKLKGFFS